MGLDPLAGIVLVAFVCFGGIVQGSIGFGFGLVVLPVAALIVPESVPQILLLMTLPTVALIWWQERAHVSWNNLIWVVSGRILGTGPGLLLVIALTTRSLQVLFALITIVAVLTMSSGQVKLPVHRRSQFVAGIVSGTMATSTSLGGPPLALLYARKPHNELRGMMAASLLGGNIFSLGGLALAGRFTKYDLLLTFWLALPLVLGMVLSNRVLNVMTASALRATVYIVIGTSASVLFISSLTSGGPN